MTKRFCDTEIWTKDWFIDLDTKHKLLTKFLFDSCDCAGIYKISWKMLNFLFDDKITLDDFRQIKQVKIIDDNTVFVEDFVLFQQSLSSLDDLNPNNKAHLGIIRRLKEIKPLLSPNQGATEGLVSPPSIGIGIGNSKGINNLSSFGSFLLSDEEEKVEQVFNSELQVFNSELNKQETPPRQIDPFADSLIDKCFTIYQENCPDLCKLRFERRSKDIRELTAKVLTEIDRDIGVFTEICKKANDLKVIVDKQIDFKKMLNCYQGILNGKYNVISSPLEESRDELIKRINARLDKTERG